MKTKRTLSVVAGFALFLLMGAARAQEREGEPGGGFDHAVPAVEHALEIGVGGGWLQGTGDIGKQMGTVQDLSGPGASAELQLGYRIIPQLAFGAYGTYGQFAKGAPMTPNTDVRSVSAGLFADWHFRPARSVDPWIGLATGWRGLWVVPPAGKNASLQGLELARLQVGLDYRISREVAIAPVLSAGLSTFLTHDDATTNGFTNIGNPSVNAFFFAGLQARFDVLGTPVK